MKRMKKFLAFVLAMIMCLGMAVTVSADEGKGTITISNATIGQSYTAYRIFEANPSGQKDAEGKDIIAYIASEAQYQLLEGEDSVYKAANPFSLTKNVNNTYNVSLKNGVSPDTAINFFYTGEGENRIPNTGLLNALKLGSESTKTANAATVVFENMDYGYYLITSTLGTTITLTSTNFNANVIDKNQKGPHWDDKGGKVFVDDEGNMLVDAATQKALENNSANYGDVVNFQLKMDNATNYDGEEMITHYFIKDTLAKGMTYVTAAGSNDADVTVQIQGNGEAPATPLTKGTDYTIKMTDNADGSHSFEITIKWADINGNTVNFKHLASPYKITVGYSATVNENAELAGTGNSNTAEFGYAKVPVGGTPDPDPAPSYEKVTETTNTYVFALAINKVDPKGAGLEGAEFTVTDEGGNVISVVGDDGVYSYAKSDAQDAKTSVVSGKDGLIIIKGVKEGKYTITEIKAPAGYNKLDGTKEVEAEIAEASTYVKEITIYKDADGNVVDQQVNEAYDDTVETDVNVSAINVINKAGSLLPSTGGIGTTIFYVVGGLLAAGAGVLLITKKRMRKEQ